MLDFPDPGPTSVDIVAGESGAGYRFETWRYEGSAGDEVSADIALPAAGDPWGVLMVGHGIGSDRTAEYIAGAARVWAAAGLAVAAADAPMHGARSTGPEPEFIEMGQPAVLVQAVSDHRRLVSLMEADERLGGAPVAFLGFSMGTVLGVPFVAGDPRIRTAVFTIGGSTRVLVEEIQPELLAFVDPVLKVTDPAVYAPRIGTRPVLQMNATRDAYFSEASATALFDAFPEPKTHVFFEGDHSVWDDGDAEYRRIFGFVEDQLRS